MSNEFKSMKEFLVYISKGGKFKPKDWRVGYFLMINDDKFIDESGRPFTFGLQRFREFHEYEKCIESINPVSSIKRFQVISKKKSNHRGIIHPCLFKSKEDFLEWTGSNEDSFEFIKLIEVDI